MPPRFRSRRRRNGPRKRRKLTFIVLVSGVLVSVALLFDVVLAKMQHPRIDGGNLNQVELGRPIYARACASCHGASLEGQADWRTRLPDGRLPAPPLGAAGHAWRHPDRVLFSIIKKGPGAYPPNYKTNMPGFGKELTDEEIAAALSYIESEWPPDLRARHAARSLAFWSSAIH